MTEPTRILWTSGWDSTYRVADLLLLHRGSVEPWYVVDSERRSTKKELATLERLRVALTSMDDSVANRLLPLRAIRIEDIPADRDITARYRALTRRGHLGGQIDWLARLAKSQGIRLEMGVHLDDNAAAFLEGQTEVSHEGVHVVAESASDDLDIYRWFAFPLLTMSKLDMQEQAAEGAFSHIMEMTWFCHFPLLDGRPCGWCNPCKYTREEGLGRRVPTATALRRLQFLTLFNLVRVRHHARRLCKPRSGRT